jgi:uncharacterized protein YjbI with pentapeptide repeats
VSLPPAPSVLPVPVAIIDPAAAVAASRRRRLVAAVVLLAGALPAGTLLAGALLTAPVASAAATRTSGLDAGRASGGPAPGAVYSVVANAQTNTLTEYAANADGNAAPLATIGGPATRLDAPLGVAFDASGDLFVPNNANDTVTEYGPGATGNAAPVATIAGPATGLSGPNAVAVDGAGRLFVSDNSEPNEITEYGPGASGDATPVATIRVGQGRAINGVAVDGAGRLFVTDGPADTVIEYAKGASGDAMPVATIAGHATGLDLPSGVAVDGAGRLFVTNLDGDTVTEYASGAHGDAAPTTTISGSATGLDGPRGAAVDAAGNLVVASGPANRVTRYASGASGDATPAATIAGAATGLSLPAGVTVMPDGARCLRQQQPPAPPPGGVVFARPLDPDINVPNVLVVDRSAGALDCSSAAGKIMTDPSSITMGTGAAMTLSDAKAKLTSLWGAKQIRAGEPAPVFYPDRPQWTTTTVDVMTQTEMLQRRSSCRSCHLPGQVLTLDQTPIPSNTAYTRDLAGADLSRDMLNGVRPQGWNLSGANLSQATLQFGLPAQQGPAGADLTDANLSGAVLIGDLRYSYLSHADMTGAEVRPHALLSGSNLTGADLSGAVLSGADLTGDDLASAKLSRANLSGADLSGSMLDHTTVDATSFDRATLSGASLVALRYSQAAAPSFVDVRVGPHNGSCTMFKDTDLVHVNLTVIADVPGCESKPLFPDSTVELGLLEAYHGDHSKVDLGEASFLVDPANRADLAGKDLSGIRLSGASFVGLPVDLQRTNLNGASIEDTSFELAELAGATFHNADAAGASFRDADLATDGGITATSFAGSATNLEKADFVGADLSGASFVGADLGGAVFTRALAVGTDFSGVRAPDAVFAGAHIYGDGQAFDDATNLRGADFADAVLAGDVNRGGGFDLTHADLTGAKFDGAQCIGCNFTGSTLDRVNFSRAYLPGAVLSGSTLSGTDLLDAWLYCGDLSNSSCTKLPGPEPRWSWPLTLGSTEAYGPVPFATTNLGGVSLDDVAVCPDGKGGRTTPQGCDGHLLPLAADAPPLLTRCTAAGRESCPTVTSTLQDVSSLGSPLAVVAATPPTWSTTLSERGYDVSLADGTIRRVGDGSPRIVAGRPGQHCSSAADVCGDEGPATQARLGEPSGLAVGLDGSVYVADPVLHRVRRIDPSGRITTVAGTGAACGQATDACGDGGPAIAAQLQGPYGVSVGPAGELLIADGHRGLRTVSAAGVIGTVAGTTAYDVRYVAQGPSGQVYATSNGPDYLLAIAVAKGQVTKVVGTGTSGYNGTTNSLGLLLPGTSVQIDHPQGLTIGLDGDVVFADTANGLVRAYVPSSGHVVELGGRVTGGQPTNGFNGDGRGADQTELDHPHDVEITRGGLLVVADTGNGRVRQLGPQP